MPVSNVRSARATRAARGGRSPKSLNYATAPPGRGSGQESPSALGNWPPLGPEAALISWTRFLDKIRGNGQT